MPPDVPLFLCAIAVGAGAGTWARRADAGRCAARLREGAVTLQLHLAEPAGLDDAPVTALAPACGSGTLAVRWPDGRHDAAGTDAQVRGRWLPRPVHGRAGGTLVATEVRVLGATPSPGERLRAAAASASRRLFGARAPLIDALVSGRRSALDRGLTDDFAAAGLVHLLSISGFHVGVIIAWLVLVARAAGASRERALLGAAVIATLYVTWLGWPAPAARACGLAWLLTIGRVRQRNASGTSVLAVSCLGVLLVDPWAVRDLGAWLSAASLGGAMACVRWSDRVLGEGWFWRTLAGSVGATLATAPITAATLGTVAPIGIVLNFVAIPVAAVAVPAAVLALLLAPLPALAGAFAAGAGLALALLERLAHAGALVPGGHVVAAAGPEAALPWLALLGGAIWAVRGRAPLAVVRWRAALLLAAASWGSVAVAAWGRRPHDGVTLTLDFLDVGQGDAAVLRTPHGHWVAIDAGPATPRDDAGARVVVPFLRRQGARGLDLLVVSHAHADHVGGAAAVVEALHARAAFEPGEAWADPVYTGFLSAVAAEGTAWYPVRDGMRLELDGVTFRVLHPDTTWAEWGLDLNEDSAVLLVEYGDFRALFAGDAGLVAERRLAGHVGRVSVLKVGHHGSRTATGDAWLDELAPRAAVISVGRGNRYGHPAPETLGRLARHAVPVLRTDQDGAISVATDGRRLQVRSRHHSLTFSLSP